MAVIQLPNPVYVGTALSVGVTFYTPIAGQAQSTWPVADPGTVTLEYIGGTGADPVTWTYTGLGGQITRVSEGVYSAIVTTDNAGYWNFKWVGSPPVQCLWVYGFLVIDPPF